MCATLHSLWPEPAREVVDRLRQRTSIEQAEDDPASFVAPDLLLSLCSTTISSNFPAQLALRVKTATDSRIILDETGAEALAGQGDAFLHTAKGTIRVQVAYDGS
ncbi:hypothetical protein ACWF99_24850 [Nocardia sp. NPDC055002]